MLVSITRPIVGVALSVVAMVLSIAGLASKVWFKCSPGGAEIKLSLQRGTVSGYNGYSYVELDESLCGDLGKGFLGDVPCSAGQAALGLGVTAVLLLAAAAGMGAIIAFKKHLGGMWGGALSLNIVGGVLALASGAGYIGRMADYTNGSEACDTAQAGPILMIISGLIGFAASGLFCSCCCRPASSVPNLTVQQVQVPVQQWQAQPQMMQQGQPQMMMQQGQPQMMMQQQPQMQMQQQPMHMQTQMV